MRLRALAERRSSGADLDAIPGVMEKNVMLALISAIGLFGVPTFVLPLWGIHRRLATEKERLLAELDLRAEATLSRFHERLDVGNLGDMDALNKAISNLDLEQSRLQRMPIWPWQWSTLRGVLTAVFLPMLLWISQQLLMSVLPGF